MKELFKNLWFNYILERGFPIGMVCLFAWAIARFFYALVTIPNVYEEATKAGAGHYQQISPGSSQTEWVWTGRNETEEED